jgi:hypothetical protein
MALIRFSHVYVNFQQIAFFVEETGEYGEQRVNHDGSEKISSGSATTTKGMVTFLDVDISSKARRTRELIT